MHNVEGQPSDANPTDRYKELNTGTRARASLAGGVWREGVDRLARNRQTFGKEHDEILMRHMHIAQAVEKRCMLWC